MTTFRIDDISVNTDAEKLTRMVHFLNETFSERHTRIILGFSPLVFDIPPNEPQERAFPKILNAFSDHRRFFKVSKFGMPDCLRELRRNSNVQIAAHGLVHVDHRLLTKSQQEMSILMCCSMADAKLFVPPFNKWNKKTEKICHANGIELIKFEDGWRHLLYQPFTLTNSMWYFHTHDFTYDDFCNRLNPPAKEDSESRSNA